MQVFSIIPDFIYECQRIIISDLSSVFVEANQGQIRLTYSHNCRYNTDMPIYDNIKNHPAMNM